MAAQISIGFEAKDINFTTTLKSIDSDIKALNSGITAAAKEIELMGSSEERTSKQTELYNKLIETQNQRLAALQDEHQKAKSKLDELATALKKAQEANDPVEVAKATNAYNAQNAEVSRLETQMNKTKSALADAEKEMKDVGEETEKTTEATKEANEGFTVMKGVITNLISDAIRGLIDVLKQASSYMLQAGMDFEEGMSKVAAISGASADDVGKLTAKAAEMGAKTKFSATEAASAFEYMAMAGWKTNDMLGGIEGIMNLAAASGASLGTASDIVTDALTGMGYAAEDAGRLADVMAAASSNANTNVEMMGETFKYAAPVVGALGYSMEDAAVAIGLMANAGIKASQAGTALRSTLTNLSAPAGAAEKAIRQYGISLTDSEGKMKPFSVVMEELREKFRGLSETEQTAAAKAIAGKNAMSGFLAIINASDEDFNKLTEAINNSNGAAENMAGIMQDNLRGAIVRLQSATEGVAITIYNSFAEIAKDAVDGLTVAMGNAKAILEQWVASDQAQAMFQRIAQAVQNVVTSLVNNLEPALNTIISVVEGVLNVGASLINNWDNIVSTIRTLIGVLASAKVAIMAAQAAQLSLNIAMMSNPMTAVIAVLGSLVVALTSVAASSENVKNRIKADWEAVKNFFGDATKSISNFFKNAGDSISESFRNAYGKMQSAFSGVGDFFSGIVSKIVGTFDGIGGKFLNIGKNIVTGIWDGIQSAFGWLKEKIGDFTDSIVGAFKDFLGIHSPSTYMRDEIGKNIGLGMAEGIMDSQNAVSKAYRALLPSTSLTASADPYSVQNALGGSNSVMVDDRPIILRLNDRELGRAVRGYV